MALSSSTVGPGAGEGPDQHFHQALLDVFGHVVQER